MSDLYIVIGRNCTTDERVAVITLYITEIVFTRDIGKGSRGENKL